MPVTKKVNNSNGSRPAVKVTAIQPQMNRTPNLFNVRKMNTVTIQKDVNKNLNLFEQARNTILGNIEILEGIK